MFGPASRVPFGERGGRVRGALDVLAGRYPGFVFGGVLGKRLPVFHFHEVTPELLEPKLAYLADNGYRTVTSAAITRLVRNGTPPAPRSVVLAFDDAWSSLWTVAGPLLRKYSMQCVTYAIPGRIHDAAQLRPTIEQGLRDPASLDAAAEPLVTWPELEHLHNEGVVDVQSHTLTHSMIFAAPVISGFVTPEFARESSLDRPRLDSNGTVRFLDPGELGAPLYLRRSRMSDALRFCPAHDLQRLAQQHVAAHGGARFFERAGWRDELLTVIGPVRGTSEAASARDAAIERELVGARDLIEGALKGHRVDHICLPWGVAGDATWARLERSGYRTAFANRFRGRFAVGAGDHPYALKRLSNRYIEALPGHGRRYFLAAR